MTRLKAVVGDGDVQQDRRRLDDLATRLRTRFVDIPETETLNVNTTDDVRAAESLIRSDAP